MLEIREGSAVWLVHELTPAGPIPTVADPDGYYPYESFVETANRPVLKEFMCIELENDMVRVIICPDLGGRIHSLFDKRSGRETLFVPESIKPVRILPRLAFVPGGIEVSFPISHTPSQIEKVHCRAEKTGGRAYVWVGERELHFGLQWTVEFSLGEGDFFLTQRCFFRNPTGQTRKWMSWSNAAVPARGDTAFHFPNGPVLVHGAQVETIDWATAGPKCVGDLDRMAGFFWLSPSLPAFGVFTPSLGFGLYHVADPGVVPGMKLWSYGTGKHEEWKHIGSLSGEGYVEIQGGPIRDQSVLLTLVPGQIHVHSEFWLPSSEPMDLRTLDVPRVQLLSPDKVPWFDWPPRDSVDFWESVIAAWRSRAVHRLPMPPGISSNQWAPGGMEELGDVLSWAAASSGPRERDMWTFQLGSWLAARGQIEAALNTLGRSGDPRAAALAARLYLRCLKDPARAVASFERIAGTALACHPQVAVERDLALAALGSETLPERQKWLARLEKSEDDWVIERRIQLMLDLGKTKEALDQLRRRCFQRVHQRYVRTELWNRLCEKLYGKADPPPESLGEDDLAAFGAYREFNS
ncbi:MAG: DUF5107 domain-containing protein [Verrucomicrobiae bacterium]|nr:DUF5107 domain-containing protein [Verrucomicrobiae bacterium]